VRVKIMKLADKIAVITTIVLSIHFSLEFYTDYFQHDIGWIYKPYSGKGVFSFLPSFITSNFPGFSFTSLLMSITSIASCLSILKKNNSYAEDK